MKEIRFSRSLCLMLLATVMAAGSGQAAASEALARPPLAGFPEPAAQPAKDHPVHAMAGKPDGREGGETVFNPFPVPMLPFIDNGFTCDNSNDHDETCPFGGSTSPEVAYVYFPPQNDWLDIDLCGSGYDTKVYVYQGNYTPGNPYACNDDYYPPGHPCGSWVSRINAMPVTAGIPYYFVVDGWGGDCGSYVLRIDHAEPLPELSISFSQLSFGYEGFEDTEHSSVGRMHVEFESPSDMLFLNMGAYVPDVSTNASWIVRNMIIPSSSMGPAMEMLASRFPMQEMGIDDGMPVSAFVYGYSVTSEPLNDSEVGAWWSQLPLQGPVPVGQERVETHGYVEVGNASGIDLTFATWFPPYIPPIDIHVNSWIGCDMSNVQLDSLTNAADWNGCAPAACANSMQWLDDKHDEVDIPADLRSIYEQLSNLMNRMAGEGAGPEDILTAKLDFIEAYGLPIHVKYQASNSDGNHSSSSGESEATDSDGAGSHFPTRDWIESESAAGEDVELGVGFYYVYNGVTYRDGGHAVVVSGTGTVNGVPKIVYKHDTHQEDGTGQEQESSDVDELGGAIHLPGLGGTIVPAPGADPVTVYPIVEAAFSESYDGSVGQVPGSHTFGASSYCQWIKRTIAPGQKIKITYPNNPNRCFNSTIWRLDRTVKPPKWIKVEVWNFNSGLTREWVNTYPYPVTIAIHNDDHNSDPYTVTLETVSVSPGDTSSPSNETVYGGFSLGGWDGSAGEFGDISDLSVTADASLGLDLSTVPMRLTDDGTGTQTLTLMHQIPVWNPYWETLGLEIHVGELTGDGRLDVVCANTGDIFHIDVIDTEMISLSLSSMPPATGFEITLMATNGLDMTFDSIGLPSLRPVSTAVDESALPAALALEANHPNPFNPTTTIRFALPEAGKVSLGVFDVSGRFVASLVNGSLEAGRHEAVWLGLDEAGRPVSAGIYVYRLEAGGQVLSRKMTLVK